MIRSREGGPFGKKIIDTKPQAPLDDFASPRLQRMPKENFETDSGRLVSLSRRHRPDRSTVNDAMDQQRARDNFESDSCILISIYSINL